ncbi:methylenetetrahydrofolate reductase C-terminal domain-containing protein [Pseudohoeflea coraliihabitans]|uniref:Methylenetetrahydrofolate reductase C-terminal domain-containing protein n=1 Tax=Pseudohoeflea coraliihabitans TaxID=2860393 RepID=A0ABS6WJX9_9HYPH|nr:methylenetetrahydrofolate reductase C-terminal domain-containing protein [Pseudohoeflea sp. DP4N28-3]MBW3095772.1 methylenetetrahydrofolate reductase C-terminal domain-containing protein [Pseudohoeflea sp. DP4N28-3]
MTESRSASPRRYAIRLWSVHHARALERIYNGLAHLLLRLHPMFAALGYQRFEPPVRFLEAAVKKPLFGCRMCGQCVLSSTGMSCPMNCPKQLRNGPCGGVRANGNCEVIPDMPCVWVQAVAGAEKMAAGDAIRQVQPPVDQRLGGTSSWLRVTQQAKAPSSLQGPRR